MAAALSRADMVEEFRTVLRSDNAGFGVRSIVVEAVALGAPMPALKDDLADVVVRVQSPYAERLYALIALLRIGPDGKAAAVAAFQKLGSKTNGLRLRAEIIHRMCATASEQADIAALLKDLAADTSGEAVTNVLYELSEQMPLGDIPAVLDELPEADLVTRARGQNEWQVARFIDRILVRAWREIPRVEPEQALQWLRLHHSYSKGNGGGRSDDLRSAILERKDRLAAILDHFFDTLVVDNSLWLQLTRFRGITHFSVPTAQLLAHIRSHLARAQPGSEKELLLYHAAFSVVYWMDDPDAEAVFEVLFALGDERADLLAMRDSAVLVKIPRGYLETAAACATTPNSLRWN